MKNLILPLLLILIFSSCKRIDNPTDTVLEKDNIETPSSDYLIMSTLWYQMSAERQALCYQSFNWAKKMLDNHLDNMEEEENPAVVVDIDETMLDNSPFEGECINTNSSYTSDSWREWTDKSIANPIPGALEFCNYAKDKGVTVFYISNRKEAELTSTMKNMLDLGFPYIDSTNFLLKTNTSSKKERREKISEYYTILLLIGDNLGDFHEIFENRTENYGFNLTENFKDEFGDKFILLPNPMYGDWEKAIYGGTFKLSGIQKDSIRRSSIISYQ